MQEPWTINAFAALAGETVLDDQLYPANYQWLGEEQRYLFESISSFAALKDLATCGQLYFYLHARYIQKMPGWHIEFDPSLRQLSGVKRTLLSGRHQKLC